MFHDSLQNEPYLGISFWEKECPLKHAQAFYGADAQVAATLTLGGVARAKIDPLPDQYVLLSSDGDGHTLVELESVHAQ